MPEERDVSIQFDGQRFKGCNGLLLVANHIEGMKSDMSELTEELKAARTEITEVGTCVKSVHDQVVKNGNGANAPSTTKRDLTILGVVSAIFAGIVYARDVAEAIINAIGG